MTTPKDLELVAALGDHLPLGVWIGRVPGGELVYANDAFEEILGTKARDDVDASGFSQPYGIYAREGSLDPEDRLPFARAARERKMVIVDDLVIWRKDGREVDVRAFAKPVGDPIGYVVVAFFDITREVAAERARAEADTRLQRAQRLEAIGNLAGGIAHDFNNLIFAVKLIASALRSDERDEDRRRSFAVIDGIAERGRTDTVVASVRAARKTPRGAAEH